MSTVAIELTDINKYFGNVCANKDVSLKVESGTIHGIIGENGAGKSTLIKSILGIIKPIAGTVRVFGKDYKKQVNEVAYVPQKGSVDWDFPTTALDVVMMGTYGSLGWLRRPGKKEKKASLEALEKVGMLPFKNRQISQLSGGQQQRIFLARALVQNASIYFMDEPFQGLDILSTRQLQETIVNLQTEDSSRACIISDHAARDLLAISDRAIILANKKIISQGTPSDLLKDENARSLYFGKDFKVN